jgi:putative membrane protein
MTRTQRSALLATVALGFAAVTVAGCGSPSQYPHSKDAYGNTKTSTSKTYASNTTSSTVSPTLAPVGTTTVVVPAQTATTTTVLVPARPATTTTVLVPATTVSPNTVGSTVLVPVTQAPASTTIVGNDVDFMARASQFNATEIALSRIAYQRAQSAAVRDFAMETINTHRRMSDDLDSIALRRNVSLAWTPSPAGSQAITRLDNMSGTELDRYYLAQMIADHDAAAALYANEGAVASDVTLRSTAGGDAIYLRNRHDEAIRLQNRID